MSNQMDKKVVPLDLSAFLAPIDAGAQEKQLVPTKRIKDADGQPTKWTIRVVPTEEVERIKQESYISIPTGGGSGRRKVYQRQMDIQAFMERLAVAATVYPPLRDASLQDHYGVMGEAPLLRALLSVPAEYDLYVLAVQELNGYGEDFDEDVQEAKN